MFHFCKPGDRMVTNVNAIVFCEPCTISNCRFCAQFRLEAKKGEAGEPFEVCDMCEPTYLPNDDKTKCLTKDEWY